jgi:hypothetical protein
MLALLHNDNYIKKFPTKDITITYGPTDEGRVLLSKLNQEIAKDLGVKISELAVKDNTPKAEAPKAEATTTKKADAKKTTKK